LNNNKTSPDTTSTPSFIREGKPLKEIMNSSKRVEYLPSGNSRGTLEKSLPKAEY
jgi:hypothetical protein